MLFRSVDYGAKGELEAQITCAFTADMVHDLVSRLIGREQLWGVDPSALAPAHDFVQKYRDPAFLVALFDQQGPRHLAQDFEMVQDTFRSYANKEIAPRAEHVHRHNADVPEEVISGLAEIGAFVGADRSYVIRFDAESNLTYMTHEWCADGIPPSFEEEQGRSYAEAPQQQRALGNFQVNEKIGRAHV